MLAFDRKILYRCVAAALIWLLLMVAVFASVRSTRIVSRASKIASGAMTVAQESEVAGVREVARAFAVEWATWNGSSDNYRRRIGVFFLKSADVAQPEGVQEVTAAAVRDVRADGDKYRVMVLLHTRLLVPHPASEVQSIPQVYVPVTREDLARSKQDSLFGQEKDKAVPAWRDSLLCVEVPVQVLDGSASVAGLPVIVSPGQGQGTFSDVRLSEAPAPEFATFVNQFFNLYYSGGALANFLAPGAKIEPVSGWKLDSIGEIYVDSTKSPTAASIRLFVSAPGVNRLSQRVYMKIQPERGSYLVKEISAIPIPIQN